MGRRIKRSKSLRTWNKYKNFVFLALALLIVIVIIVVIITKTVGGGKEDETTTPYQETTTEETTPEPTTEETTPEPTTEETTPEPTTSSLDIVKTPQEETFDNEAFFDGAIFVGDTWVDGMKLYKFISDKQLISNTGWTTGKAADNAINAIANSNASRVFIELGINDLNYEGRTASKVYASYSDFVSLIKQKLPGAQIYIISTFPVTSGFAARDSICIDNKEVAALNEMLATMEGVTFLNINKSIEDESGNLMSEISSNGLNIKKGYYGFILNLIIEMCQ